MTNTNATQNTQNLTAVEQCHVENGCRNRRMNMPVLDRERLEILSLVERGYLYIRDGFWSATQKGFEALGIRPIDCGTDEQRRASRTVLADRAKSLLRRYRAAVRWLRICDDFAAQGRPDGHKWHTARMPSKQQTAWGYDDAACLGRAMLVDIPRERQGNLGEMETVLRACQDEGLLAARLHVPAVPERCLRR